MTTLLDELKIWLAAEQADPNTWLPNDTDLLERVSAELNQMRLSLLNSLDDPGLWKPYKELNDALTELLTCRINKNAKLMEAKRK